MGITMGLEVVENGIEGCLNFQDSPGQLAPPLPPLTEWTSRRLKEISVHVNFQPDVLKFVPVACKLMSDV